MNYIILQGDALELLRTLPPESVHTCVTSPPYYNLRDYGVEGPGVWVHREFRGGRADGKRLAVLPRLRAGDHRGSGQSVSVRQ